MIFTIKNVLKKSQKFIVFDRGKNLIVFTLVRWKKTIENLQKSVETPKHGRASVRLENTVIAEH